MHLVSGLLGILTVPHSRAPNSGSVHAREIHRRYITDASFFVVSQSFTSQAWNSAVIVFAARNTSFMFAQVSFAFRVLWHHCFRSLTTTLLQRAGVSRRHTAHICQAVKMLPMGCSSIGPASDSSYHNRTSKQSDFSPCYESHSSSIRMFSSMISVWA